MTISMLGRPLLGKHCNEIVALYDARQLERGPVIREMMAIRDTYNGDLVVPLPELDRDEKVAVSNLLKSGIDQMSGRVASVMPTIYAPPRNEQKPREVAQATLRTKAMYGWWDSNDYDLVLLRRARWLLGYASAPVMIRPPSKRQRQDGIFTPQWHARDPLTSFPSAPVRHDDMTPEDCIFSFVRSHGWLADTYPGAFETIRRPKGVRREDPVTVLEFVDDEELVLLAFGDRNADPSVVAGFRGRDSVGPLNGRHGGSGWVGSETVVELDRQPNRAGICTAVIPGRVTLDRIMSQFSAMIGMYETSAKLTALSIIAVEKGIFPDQYLIGRDGKTPKFLSGPHDGRTGNVNVVVDGDVREVATNPGFQTNPMLDRLERAARLEGGIPAEFGGESTSNIRTGKRGNDVLGAAVTFPIQEQQKLLAKSAKHELQRAIAVSKGYFGARTTSVYVNWKGAKGNLEYKPNDLFTTDNVVVSYAMAGTDANGQAIMVGQKVGMGIMSKHTGATLDPMIEDAEFERDQITVEAIDSAILAAVQQKANAGEIPLEDLAWIKKQVRTNKMELDEAVMAADERRKKLQQEALDQQADPNQPNPMPGLEAATPAAAAVVPPSIPGPNESQEGLASLLGRLRQPQMTLASERPAV